MKIVLASAPVTNGAIDANIKTMCLYAKRYGGKADLILFGEAALHGFDALSWDYESDKEIAVCLDSPQIQIMRESAKENQIALCFGFYERVDEVIYSSQIFIGADGEICNLFRRVSVGWKDCSKADSHYREGKHFSKFKYKSRCFTIGLCGDLWTDGKLEEIASLEPDVVLWPVWCDYQSEKWNSSEKYEYAAQAALCGKNVLLVNPFCVTTEFECKAKGGCVHFQCGEIRDETPAGDVSALIVDV